MAPPPGRGSPVHFNAQAPLSHWEFVGLDDAFATSVECKQEQKKLHEYFTGLCGHANIDGFERGLLTQAWIRIDAAQCISSDDPRLTEK
jgi:hypothetical protein